MSNEFERLCSSGEKLNTNLLLMLAQKLIEESNPDEYGSKHTDPRSRKIATGNLDMKWVERFMHANHKVSRVRKGKATPSDKYVEMVEREVAYHLGTLKWDLEFSAVDEDYLFNADETHFVVDPNDGRTLAMKGDKDVSFADVVSGDVGMTMMVFLGGVPKAYFGVPFIIF